MYKIFDGDTSAIYVNHDQDALRQMWEKAAIRNTVFYDAKDDFLSTIRHEALYAAYVLSHFPKPRSGFLAVDSLKNLPEKIKLFNERLRDGVTIDGKLYTYGICLLNKWCGFDKIHIDELITKKQIQMVSQKIYEVHGKDSKKFYDHLYELEKKLMFFISMTNYVPTLSLEEMVSLVDDHTHELIRKLPSHNPHLAYYLNNALIDRCVDGFDHNSNLYQLYKSGSRFSKTQLARSCIDIGLISDENNIVSPDPIRTSLIEGLNPEEFFAGSPGTRKGLIDKDKSVPESGYLERSLTMALAYCELTEDDCGDEEGLEIRVMSPLHLKTLVGKYWNEGFFGEEWKVITGEEKHLIGQRITIRSPMTCQTKNFKVCKKCFGEKRVRTPYVGITAAQVATERLTQLLMRSFHTSGSCELDLNQDVSKFIQEHLKDIVQHDSKIQLLFDTEDLPKELNCIPGFLGMTSGVAEFAEIQEKVSNNDTLAVVNKVKALLRKDDSPQMTPAEYYQEFMDCILSVGESYSSYIELILAHIFMTDEENFWRYNRKSPIKTKLSEKTIASKISPLLGFLFQPNKISIKGVSDEILTRDIPDDDSLSFFEKIFLHKI